MSPEKRAIWLHPQGYGQLPLLPPVTWCRHLKVTQPSKPQCVLRDPERDDGWSEGCMRGPQAS